MITRKQAQIPLLILALLIALAASPLTATAAGEEPYSIYLPGVVSSGPGRVLSAAQPGCQLSAQEQALADLMAADPGQQRPNLQCSPILAQVARAKAEDMARRGYFAHVDPDGRGANYLVEQAGYDLRWDYDEGMDANNIESLAADYTTAAWVWHALLQSPTHRVHVLGETEFFQDQVDYGIGFAHDPDAPYQYYWVILTAVQ